MRPRLLDRLFRIVQPLQQAVADEINQLLLSGDELQQLADMAEQPAVSPIAFERYVAQRQLGDVLSRFRGHGFEFEENRRYQPGDEQRLINWRLYARRGELFSKVYVEERRPEVCLLLDRRATMRFGTRNQLKVNLAARLAAYTLFQAQSQAIPVGGVVLDKSTAWYAAGQRRHAIQPLLEAIAAPCPPLPFESTGETLHQVLSQLDLRWPDGSFILLISDFMDLKAETSIALLRRLADKHTVQAIQIIDPAEDRLPEMHHLVLDNPDSDQPLIIDSKDANRQSAYIDAFNVQQESIRSCFTQCHIPLYRCYTNDSLQVSLQQEALKNGH